MPQRLRGRRGEHDRVIHTLAVVREDRVARNAQCVEARYGDVGEHRDVRRHGHRIGPVEAVQSRREQPDAETRVFRETGTSGEGDVDLLFERAVHVRSLEVPDDPAQKPFAFPRRPLFLRFTVLPGTLLGVFPNFRVFRRDGRRDLSQRVALRDADTHGRPSRKDGADRYEGNEGDSAQHALYRYWSSTS